MKITPAQFRGFCRSLPPQLKSVMLYGESEAETHPKLTRLLHGAFKKNLSDFQLVDGAQLAKKEVFLEDLLANQSLFGPSKPVLVQKATDKVLPILQEYFESGGGDGPLVVVADGYLKPASKLRQAYEGEDHLAVVACYAPSIPEVSQDIVESFTQLGKTLDRDAVQLLALQVLQGGFSVSLEIEKIASYVGDRLQITLEDVQKCTCQGLKTADDKIYEAFLRRAPDALLYALSRAQEDDLNQIEIVRGLGAKLMQLSTLKSLIAEGKPFDQALRIVKPPIFFQQKDLMRAAIGQWSAVDIHKMMRHLTTLEHQVKVNTEVGISVFSMELKRAFTSL